MRLEKTVHIEKHLIKLSLKLASLLQIIGHDCPIGSLQSIISLCCNIESGILNSISDIKFIILIRICYRKECLDTIKIMLIDVHGLASMICRTLLPQEAGIIGKIVIYRLSELVPEFSERRIRSSVTCSVIRLKE